ncbi:hypothetical protein DBT_1256 [Dissulfuribacter thermophilus]|uniref:Class III cytochrome C domain-containing protein n=1 Tax=Dissulfuribacter thermophilus TaxID=1156395 RepID=A0A1B9F6E9_9BACT|nr:cytochrome c3 family protein [Dissulfuribacter thermophilus]OCC15509.1 hypothetical protein DBT_1256 [Dissulfuribacter thermophilus]
MKLKKTILTLAGITVSAVFMTSHPVTAKDIPETIDINVQARCQRIKGLPKDLKAVNGFSHRDHALNYLKGNSKYSPRPYKDDFTCVACHVGASDEKAIMGSDACKGLEDAFSSVGGPKKFKKFYHETCAGCHKAMKRDGKETGPTSCRGCHAKKTLGG